MAAAAGIAVLPPVFVADADFETWIYRALVVLVVSCPCALALAAPLAIVGTNLFVPGGEPRKLERARDAMADTVLLGSTGGVTPGVMHLRYGRGTWANLRPVRWRPGFASPYARPEGIDYLIVRESHATVSATPKIMSFVLPSWTTSPLIRVRTAARV